MAINAQGEPGRIRLFYDFYGEDSVANTAELRSLGPFCVGGQGSAEADAGVPTIAGVLSGAGRITTTNEEKGANIETLDVDYILVKSNRDWNA
jgi:hypothetical protein